MGFGIRQLLGLGLWLKVECNVDNLRRFARFVNKVWAKALGLKS